MYITVHHNTSPGWTKSAAESEPWTENLDGWRVDSSHLYMLEVVVHGTHKIFHISLWILVYFCSNCNGNGCHKGNLHFKFKVWCHAIFLKHRINKDFSPNLLNVRQVSKERVVVGGFWILSKFWCQLSFSTLTSSQLHSDLIFCKCAMQKYPVRQFNWLSGYAETEKYLSSACSLVWCSIRCLFYYLHVPEVGLVKYPVTIQPALRPSGLRE